MCCIKEWLIITVPANSLRPVLIEIHIAGVWSLM